MELRSPRVSAQQPRGAAGVRSPDQKDSGRLCFTPPRSTGAGVGSLDRLSLKSQFL